MGKRVGRTTIYPQGRCVDARGGRETASRQHREPSAKSEGRSSHPSQNLAYFRPKEKGPVCKSAGEEEMISLRDDERGAPR